jgi:hypothetical protein
VPDPTGVNSELSKGEGLVRSLDRADVLRETVAQLRKDLACDEEALRQPPVGDAAFEALREQLLVLLEAWQRSQPASLSRAINRVDLNERQVNEATARGGLHELAGSMVVRCLQKVLSRHRFAGRF